MMFFRHPELTVRCVFRGLSLSVPDRDRLLNACDPAQRHRLQRSLAKAAADEAPWEVQWQRMPGEPLQPDEVVVALHRDGVVAELTSAQRGTLGEWLVTRGALVGEGAPLGILERRKKAPASPDLVRQYVVRQRRDAETIAGLKAELAMLKARLVTAPGAGEVKFKRLKLEFSKHFHPDAGSSDDAERALRTRVFQEFWPVVEEIERS